ncbi:MAG: M16 family metallopeptidase [Geoalkalibacter sp.]|jgi:zinc protease|uniref:M16 family metallopeptidase n=1 Tax=Geoalkalibacter sp. TaxID=3041440 RepID=UPI002AA08533|nr:pitrilysin family protein [Thermodesulfobacteriota bacterium]
MNLRKLAFLLLPIAMLAFCVTGCSLSAPEASPRNLTFAPLEFDVPEIAREKRENGLQLYLKPDHELPLVRITAMLGVGAIVEPPEKTGLAAVYASLLRQGGAGELDPDEMDETLERMAADFSADADTYAVTLEMSLRAEDLDRGLGILSQVLRRPRFDSARLEIIKRRMQEEIRRRNDDPAQLSRHILYRALYGEHPLGLRPEVETVNAVERVDLVELHRRYSHPNNLQIGISGDFDPLLLEGLVARHFDNWPAGSVAQLPIPPLGQTPAPAIWVASKELSQTTILLGEIGLTKDNPDQYAVRVMNYLLGGGGFNSRLMRKIRSDRGLAYSVYSYYQVGRRLPGPFVAGCETRPDAVDEVIELMQQTMEEMRSDPVSQQDLKLAKESLINSFVFTFEDQHDVVAMTMRLDYYDYPADYLSGYRDRIAAVTRADVMRVARRYLDPERQALVLVGDIDADDPALRRFEKPVRVFDLE